MTDFLKARTTQHNIIKRALERLEKAEETPLNLGALDIIQKTVDDAWGKIDQYHQQVLSITQDEEGEIVQFQEMEKIMDSYFGFITKISELRITLKEETPKPTPTPIPTPASTPSNLPKMSLPEFHGQYENWPAFEDLFRTIIHNAAGLSNSQKLYYLKSCVKGRAAPIISGFTITDANYNAAWALLLEKYDRKREIVHALIRKLLNQPKLITDSATSLQSLIDTTNEVIRQLEVMGRPVKEWDDLLVVIILDKLDSSSKGEWANSLEGNDLPKYSQLVSFLDKRLTTYIARGPSSSTKPQTANASGTQSQSQNSFKQQSRSKSNFATATPKTQYQIPPCCLCGGTHSLYHCQQLRSAPADKREEMVRKTSACINCLRTNHQRSSCPSSTCRICGRAHHTLIHGPNNTNKQKRDSNQSNQQQSSQSPQTTATAGGQPNNAASGSSQNTTSAHHVSKSQVSSLLKTAIVKVTDSFGNDRSCRALLDDGSESSFMTLNCAKGLGLQLAPADTIVTGVSRKEVYRVRNKANVRLHSCINDLFVDVEVLLLPSVTGVTPRKRFDVSELNHLRDLQLADPTFHIPGRVDLLIGMNILMGEVMLEGFMKGPVGTPAAQQTIFGWVIGGAIGNDSSPTILTHLTCNIENVLQRFWEIEDSPRKRTVTREEQLCEEHFTQNTIRLPSGRYQVRLPTNSNLMQIGETRNLALSRLHMLEKRFRRNPAHQAAYQEFMDEYINLGHMEPAQSSLHTSHPIIYIPHHFVLKEDSSTTKLRVVFDASMKSSSGISLNDALMVGPTVQDELVALLMRFRLNPIAIKADIAKMYRQFEVHPDDRKLQRILWRRDASQPVLDYQLNTITYGTGSASYLATRCLKQLALDEQTQFPAAAFVLLSDTYVDDLISGAKGTTGAVHLVNQLISLVHTGGMEIRKWSSNDPKVMAAIPENLRETGSSLTFDNSSIKALGIKWEPEKDVFKFEIPAPTPRNRNLRKNELLGEIAKTYDPLGWLSPVTIRAKLLFQSLWKDKKEWSDLITEELQSEWEAYQTELEQIRDLDIPRYISTPTSFQFELHGFSDASEKAYAAAVYLKSISNEGILSHLITSKTKIAPLKQRSLPRLELCGALLLAELITYTKAALKLDCSISTWTDSMIVLHWLNSESRRWKTFVANRVADIQELVPPHHWKHVVSQENPADLPTRGIAVADLLNSNLWWHGPEWLCSPHPPPSNKNIINPEIVNEEERSVPQVSLSFIATVNKDNFLNHFAKFSSFEKCIISVVWLKRVVCHLYQKTKNMPLSVYSPVTSPVERKQALNKILLLTQQNAFPEELIALKKSKEVSNSSRLIRLTPFLDIDGILRVGGRLQQSTEKEGKIHPIILPNNHFITTLLIREYHHRLLHAGPTLVLAELRRKYWIIGGRDIVRRIISDCIICKKVKATTATQLMGSLPSARVTANKPFSHCGVDLAGPFLVKLRRGRGHTGDKCWMVIFVCFSTKAVHLDAVLDLSTESFLAAFKRFTSRRGIPSHMFSDNGTNFIGANRTLIDLNKFSMDKVQQRIATTGTTWTFNPPSAPHQGGLWESGVKSVKFHLKRVIGDRLLTYEQFITVLCCVEACLNSRPLCPLSPDPLDFNALTPGHFLINQPITAVPEPDLTLQKMNRLSYWQEAQQLSQHFWRRWKDEYLSTLQQRVKWQRKEENVKLGDLVVLREDNLPPTKWKLGRVVEVFPGQDELVRKVAVKTATGIVTRPITKLSVLITEE